MQKFENYLDKFGEVGFVEEILNSLVYATGLPEAHPKEIVVFEDGGIGQVLTLTEEKVEILALTQDQINVGSRVARTGEIITVPMGPELLGRAINPLGVPIDGKGPIVSSELRKIDIQPEPLVQRTPISKPLETGVTIVDLVVPLGKGQRELVIGDRKTGKTEFLLQSVFTQAQSGTVCIYAIIGQRKIDIIKLQEFMSDKLIRKNCILIASSSSEPPGLIFLTPYTAMTVAEYFRDQGRDVLLVLDDLTTHARKYREISLTGRRFPGRSSYPGDIFYVHAKLLERGGSYQKGTISVMPVAESVLGDLSGYIQTNLMAMTDGHIFFDINLFNQGKRPAINPFISVTRVGHQTQTPLQKDVSRELSSFLVSYQRMKQFMHFGAEIGGTAKYILALGEHLDAFFNQEETAVSVNINLLILAGLWSGLWNEKTIDQLKIESEKLISDYNTDNTFQNSINTLISNSKSFSELVSSIRHDNSIILSRITTT